MAQEERQQRERLRFGGQPVPCAFMASLVAKRPAPKCSLVTAAQTPCDFAAVDDRGAPRSHREGVLWHPPTATNLLFMTLCKNETLFSPTTRYRDLALGPTGRAGTRLIKLEG